MANGIRLTCPMCRDTSVFFPEQIKAAKRIFCDNHPGRVEMVDLAELMEILGSGKPLDEQEEIDFNRVVEAGMIHPDDFEDWG